MLMIRPILAAMSVALVATIGTASMAVAQPEKPRVSERVGIWTRTQFEAAQKRWAEDQQRFIACSHKLDEEKKMRKRRMTYHRQADVLGACMRESH